MSGKWKTSTHTHGDDNYTTLTYVSPGVFKLEPSHLTQADIDRPDEPKDPHPIITWCEAIPGIILTIIVLASFVAGCWGAVLLWEMVK